MVQAAPPGAQGPADAVPSVQAEEAERLCRAFSEALLDVQDVDEQDADLPQLCSDYVKDIYNYLRDLEVVLLLPLGQSCRFDSFSCFMHRSIVRLHRCSRP